MGFSISKVPIGARFTRLFAFLNVSVIGLLFAFFFASSPVALAESGLNALYFLDYINLEGSTSQPSEAGNAMAGSSNVGPQVTQDPIRAALENRGYNVTQVDNYPSFESAIASDSWDLVIMMNQDMEVGDIPNFLAYVAGGGRAILTDWSQSDPLGSAFGVGYTGNDNQEPVTITDSDLSVGLPNPLSLVNPGWSAFSMGMSTTETVLATFPNGDAAVVLGNEGRTAAVGFLNDTIPTDVNAIQFYENIIDLVDGTAILRLEPTSLPPVTLRQDEDPSTQTLTLYNDGDGVLRATLSTVGVDAHSNGGNPQLIPGEPQSDSSMRADWNAGSENAKEVGELNPVFTPLAENLEVLYVNTMGGYDPSFISGLQGLPNIGTLDILDATTSTPNVDYLLQYDVVILASNSWFADSSTLGNNLADYVDAGGGVILLVATFATGGGYALDGRIITPTYLPLAMGEGGSDSTAVSIVNHPITQGVNSLSAALPVMSFTTQGNGQSLGTYDTDYLIGAYNHDKPIVAINVFPADGSWSGDLIRLVGNALDWVASSGPGWLSVTPTEIKIPPQESVSVEVTYDAINQAVGDYTANIIIASNDPVNPEVTVPATLHVDPAPPPVLRVEPTSLPPVTLRQDENPSTQTLTLYNDGDGELMFDLRTEETTATSGISETNPIPYMEIGKGEDDPRQGPPVTQGRGGPDAFGYSWIDSDELGGPTFDWVDISSTGTRVTGLTDDNHVGPFPIGFNFDFYENAHTEFYVQSNGVINFENRDISLDNQPIPVADGYNNLIAWMWDDLYPYSDSSVYYQVVDDNKLVIQFQNYGKCCFTSGQVDAQVILYRNGNIRIQYLEFRNSMVLHESTIGIENQDGTDGLQVAFNVSYLHNELAILFTRGASWLTPEPISGTIPAGGSQDITLTYNAKNQAVGDYTANIIIASNDPVNPEVTVPATLHVDPPLPPEIVLSPTSIEDTLILPDSPPSDHTLTLSNTGEGRLTYNLSVTKIPTTVLTQSERPVLTDIPDGVEYAPGELIIKLRKGAVSAAVVSLRESVNATVKKTIEQLDLEVWTFPVMDESELLNLIKELSANSNIEYAEPNYRQKAIGIPNDARFDELWGMHNTGLTGGTEDADIDAVEAWDIFTGSHDVVVAVIDTGMDYNHVDLVDNRWINEDEIAGNGVDDDGNGFVDDVYGYDFAYNDSDPMDGDSHGTHCSGTIGAVGNNGIGVAGVSHAVRIMAVKFIDDWGWGSTDDAIESVIYAVDNGAQILSNSWGSSEFSQGLEDAISYANDHNVLFVAAAGNEYSDNDVYPNYPSNYEVPNVLAVAATDHNDAKAPFSNYGLTSVDLGAPGVDTLSTVPGNGYDYFSGTSMATPHVSGAAALLKGYNPSLTALELKSLIMESVDPVASMDGITVTGGRLNINNALMMAGTPWITLEGELSGEIPPGGSVDVIVRLDATALRLGDYTADINVDSNDPVNPHQVVPVVLHTELASGYSTIQLSSATYSTTEDGGRVTITVTRTGASNGAITVDYATNDDTATAGSDYTATSGTLNWADGDTANKTFTININDDNKVEGDETVIISLDNVTGSAILDVPDTAVLTITDDDLPTLCMTVTEIPLAECQALVNIYNSTDGALWKNNSGWNVTNTPCSWHGIQCSGGHITRLYLQYNHLSGTIPAGIGNLSHLEVLNIMNNDLCGNIPVGLMNLTQLWALSLDYNHLSASDPELIDWLNNLNPGWETTQSSCPVLSTLQLSSATYSIRENGGQASITVTRRESSNGAISVDYATSDDTATAGSDYTATSGTLNWADGEMANKTFTININDDSQEEDNETVIVSLNNATGGAVLGVPDTAVLTIRDNDLSTVCTTVTEIPPEECQALVDIYNSTNGDLWNDNTGWNVTNTPCSWHGTQCSGGHITRLYLQYNQLSGVIPSEIENLSYLEVLNIRNNDLCGNIPVELMNLDHLWALSLDYNHLTASESGLINWLNNLNPGWDTTQTSCPVLSTLQLSSATYSIMENGGQASITVTRTGASDGATSVDYATSDDTATAGNDYTATLGTLNWGDGDTANKSFTININDDSQVEGDETVIVSLDNATGDAVLGVPDTAVLTIRDNDDFPTVCTTVTEIPLEECQALVEIYNSTNGDLWKDNSGWNVTNTPCSWHGTQCSGGHITRVYLQYNQLSGTIPPEIENLSYLEVLNIRNNDLCGNIPVELMNLEHLWALSLDYNHLSASEPGLIDWLNNLNPGWDTTQTSCPEPSSF
jgi:subtilisin family serine protease